MIDIKLLQKDYESVANALKRKKVDETILADLKDLSLKTKENKAQMESLQAQINTLSSKFGEYKKAGQDTNELKFKLMI